MGQVQHSWLNADIGKYFFEEYNSYYKSTLNSGCKVRRDTKGKGIAFSNEAPVDNDLNIFIHDVKEKQIC